MTELLEKECATEGVVDALLPVIGIKQAIEARLAEIHGEPAGRNKQICDALMIGSSAICSQYQV